MCTVSFQSDLYIPENERRLLTKQFFVLQFSAGIYDAARQYAFQLQQNRSLYFCGQRFVQKTVLNQCDKLLESFHPGGFALYSNLVSH